jgi:hypothetical protein
MRQECGHGFGIKTCIIFKAEAATIYALHTITFDGLKAGDSFTIGDAETVDLMSYRVTSIRTPA